MAGNSIVISCLFTQSDICNHNVRMCWEMLTATFNKLLHVWHFVAKICERFKKGMLEGI